MTASAWLQAGLYLAAILLLAKPVGLWMARVFEGDIPRPLRFLRPIERGIYRITRVRPDAEMTWREYLWAVLGCGLVGLVLTYAVQRAQHLLPVNPQGLGAVSPYLALNTAVSFVTNTNWQSYGGETTMSYLTQMLVLTVQNFVSAATGLGVLAALIRGLVRESARTLGNFWADLVRGTLYILLPLSLVFALLLVSQGVVQTFAPSATVIPLEQTEEAGSLSVALGPAASQVAIKQLGTNGGGFFNVNSAHPLENPTPLANFLEMLAILLLPAASCCMFGRMVRQMRQGWAVLAAMTALFALFLAVAIPAEQAPSAAIRAAYLEATSTAPPPGGNLEGKEVRFGIGNSAIWATATTAASNGSVNSMHDSMTPLGGAVPLLLMQLGEVVYGGIGSGLYGMLVFVILTVFVSGLMVGRTPEYLGKKIGAYEMKLVSLAILINPIFTLLGTAVAVRAAAGTGAVLNPGIHGFSEILYALSSGVNNNGSAFGGLNAGGSFYCLLLAVAMFVGRYWVIVPTLALAGALAGARRAAAGEGTLPTHSPTFVLVLMAIVLIVGALTFFPALTLGPLAEAMP